MELKPYSESSTAKSRPTGLYLGDGTPPITMTALADNGVPPKGQDFNGVINAISQNTVFVQNGGRYKWTSDIVDNFGGYPKDHIIQSDDGLREYVSLVDNNTINPNEGLAQAWAIYSGNGEHSSSIKHGSRHNNGFKLSC